MSHNKKRSILIKTVINIYRKTNTPHENVFIYFTFQGSDRLHLLFKGPNNNSKLWYSGIKKIKLKKKH